MSEGTLHDHPSYDGSQATAATQTFTSPPHSDTETPQRRAITSLSRKPLSRVNPTQRPPLVDVSAFHRRVVEAKRTLTPLHIVLHELQNQMYPLNLVALEREYVPPPQGEYERLCAQAERWYREERSSTDEGRTNSINNPSPYHIQAETSHSM
ncbi:hypothetical protein V5O48_015754, partial [Marasmius crinis-equi]